jgi:hypothetical protein
MKAKYRFHINDALEARDVIGASCILRMCKAIARSEQLASLGALVGARGCAARRITVSECTPVLRDHGERCDQAAIRTNDIFAYGVCEEAQLEHADRVLV